MTAAGRILSALEGPKSWALAAFAGLLLGFLHAMIAPFTSNGTLEETTLWLCFPFAGLLLCIALLPLVVPRFWHAFYPAVALFLGALVAAYSVTAFGERGRTDMLHAAVEYYAFIALVGGLYVASGGILIGVRARATPARNTVLLGAGAVLANIVGTTGASVLLIRPFLRTNSGRLRPIHIVFFIFIVSNCGGCLTPIGDPPLYLGFLRGVPFFWTLEHMWPMWLLVNGLLLALFFAVDWFSPPAPARARTAEVSASAPLVSGWPSAACVLGIVACVFVDPLLRGLGRVFDHVPVGATLQIALAVLAWRLADPAIHRANRFKFEPVKEVGFLFAGIFLTMAPALEYLSVHAPELHLRTPTQYYFATGGLSGALDNAPTYACFLEVALGTLGLPATPEGIHSLIEHTHTLPALAGAPAETISGQVLIEAIALGAVFFGAMTYIGNGPNFMVKAIVDAAFADKSRTISLGTQTPSFFGYLAYAVLILLPVLVVNWLVFIR